MTSRPLPFLRRKTFWALIVAVAVLSGWLLWGGHGDKQKNGTAPGFTEVSTGDIEEVVTAQGKLEPKEYVDVGAQVSGQLKKLHVDIGDVVKKGSLLAEIDPQLYESRLAADQAQLKNLQAQLTGLQAQVLFATQQQERNERLIKSKAISQAALEDTGNQLKAANAALAGLKAQIEQQQSTLKGDETNLSYTKIYAPMSGTVVSQTTREGQTVNASQSAPVIVQIADLDVMMVRAQVAEADVMRLKPHMDVYFTTLGALDKRWKGKVRQILPSPEVINDVVLYDALVDVGNKDRQLMTGMSVQMFFVLGSVEDVPVIPVVALGKRLTKQDTDKGQAYQVRVKQGAAVVEKMVHIGLMSRTSAQVVDGLALGDEVAVTQPAATGAHASQGGGGPPRGPRL